MWVLALAEDLEARALKIESSNESSGQYTASEVASHARQATGLAETAGAGRWVSSESVPTKNPRRFHHLEQMAIFKKRSQGLTTCISALLLYQYRHCGRPQWKNEKYLIMTTRPEL